MTSDAPVRKKRGRPPKKLDIVERIESDMRLDPDSQAALDEMVRLFRTVPAKDRPWVLYTCDLAMKHLSV